MCSDCREKVFVLRGRDEVSRILRALQARGSSLDGI